MYPLSHFRTRNLHHNYGYYEALRFSAKKNNFKLINLAYDKKWKGLMWKFKLLLNKIENVDDNERLEFG